MWVSSWEERYRIDLDRDHGGCADWLRNLDIVPAAPCAGAHANHGSEDSRKVTLVREPAGKSNIRQRRRTIRQQFFCAIHSMFEEPAMRRNSGRPSECAGKMPDRQTALRRQPAERNVFLQVCAHQFLHGTFLPWRQSTLGLASVRAHATIHVSHVSTERQSDVVQE